MLFAGKNIWNCKNWQCFFIKSCFVVCLHGGLTCGGTTVTARAPFSSLFAEFRRVFGGVWFGLYRPSSNHFLQIFNCRSWFEQDGKNAMLLWHRDRRCWRRTRYNGGKHAEMAPANRDNMADVTRNFAGHGEARAWKYCRHFFSWLCFANGMYADSRQCCSLAGYTIFSHFQRQWSYGRTAAYGVCVIRVRLRSPIGDRNC